MVKCISCHRNKWSSKYANETLWHPSSGTTVTSYDYSTRATDPDGDQVKYTFDWGDGTTPTVTGLITSGIAASASHSWAQDGIYLVKAMATDSDGASSGWSNALAVTITTGAPTTPSIPFGPTYGSAGTSYSYSTIATDPGGDQVKYTFDWGDGTTPTVTGLVTSGVSASASHSWSSAGTYRVKAMATDSGGASSGWSSALTVIITTGAPTTPSIPFGPTYGSAGTSYSYSTIATDPGGDQVKYTFDWGDGTTPTVTGLVLEYLQVHLIAGPVQVRIGLKQWLPTAEAHPQDGQVH